MVHTSSCAWPRKLHTQLQVTDAPNCPAVQLHTHTHTQNKQLPDDHQGHGSVDKPICPRAHKHKLYINAAGHARHQTLCTGLCGPNNSSPPRPANPGTPKSRSGQSHRSHMLVQQHLALTCCIEYNNPASTSCSHSACAQVLHTPCHPCPHPAPKTTPQPARAGAQQLLTPPAVLPAQLTSLHPLLPRPAPQLPL